VITISGDEEVACLMILPRPNRECNDGADSGGRVPLIGMMTLAHIADPITDLKK
jgi:hypothetical protein